MDFLFFKSKALSIIYTLSFSSESDEFSANFYYFEYLY